MKVIQAKLFYTFAIISMFILVSLFFAGILSTSQRTVNGQQVDCSEPQNSNLCIDVPEDNNEEEQEDNSEPEAKEPVVEEEEQTGQVLGTSTEQVFFPGK